MGQYSAPSHPSRTPRRAVRLIASALVASLAGGCATPAPAPEATSLPAPTATVVRRAPATVEALPDRAAASRSAGPIALQPEAPLRYVVQPGDTLWSIAGRFLRDPWQWPELWYGNGSIENPHRIRPGDVLTLARVDGQTRLAVFDGPTERLSPRIREAPLDSAVPAIPIEAIRDFLRGPRLVTLEEARKAPYIVAFDDDRLAVGADSEVFVRNLGRAPARQYAVVRLGGPYRDPDSRRVLGHEAIPAGEAEWRGAPDAETPPIATLRLTRTSREVLVADRLLPIEAESFEANFYPHPPAQPVEGRIISVFDGLTQISQYQIVALNRGSDAGLDPGTVLDIRQAGRTVRDPVTRKGLVLPDQYAGVLMVFKVTPGLAYGLVMNAERPIHVLDRVSGPLPDRPR